MSKLYNGECFALNDSFKYHMYRIRLGCVFVVTYLHLTWEFAGNLSLAMHQCNCLTVVIGCCWNVKG